MAYEFGCSAIDLEGIPESLTPVIKHRAKVEPPTDNKKSSQREPNSDNQTSSSTGSTNISQTGGDNALQFGQIGRADNINIQR